MKSLGQLSSTSTVLDGIRSLK